MSHEVNAYQQLLLDRYLDMAKNEQDRGVLIGLGIGPKEYGFEGEMLEYLEKHPDATLQELDDYAAGFYPELIVEDDDE